jgi:hypothetical protein
LYYLKILLIMVLCSLLTLTVVNLQTCQITIMFH